MRFVDRARIEVRAGRGGDGMVAWRREAHVPRGGPAGGDGGRGGDVVLEASDRLTTLLELKYRPLLRAEDGTRGGSQSKTGRAGDSLVVRVPVGTMVFLEEVVETEPDPDADPDVDAGDVVIVDDETGDAETGDRRVGDLVRSGQTLVIARGGRGGKGNVHFRSSTNRAPMECEPGTSGEALRLRLELKLLADVGIVGYPNVGKSTLIARISRARPKIADYPFTTLVPHLGVVALDRERSMVVADVPGLVDGASEGKGLGHTFLRHLERTRVLLHLLAVDPTPGREPLADLDRLEDELRRYGPMFEGRPRVVALNKVDALGDDEGRALIEDLRRSLAARNVPLFPISAHTGEGIPRLLEALHRRLEPAGPASDAR